MAQNSAAAPAVRSSLERDYEYDIDNDVFLFYPSPPAFESSRDDLFPSYPTGFYNLPAFRNDGERSPLSLRLTESVYSDYTATTCVDEGFYGREGGVLRSIGYSRCYCLGLISIGGHHPAATQDYTQTPAQSCVPIFLSNFFAKLWDKLLRR